MQGKDLCDLRFEFKSIWRVRFSSHGFCQGHATEGSFKTTCSSAQGKSKRYAPKKSKLFALHIIWSGRKISKDGVSFDPAYLKGLTELPRPQRAKRLQHFLSALN